MTEVEEDDVFLRTDDKIYFQCTRTHENKQGCFYKYDYRVVISDMQLTMNNLKNWKLNYSVEVKFKNLK